MKNERDQRIQFLSKPLEIAFAKGKTTNHRYQQRQCLREAVKKIQAIKFNPRKKMELDAFKKRARLILNQALYAVTRIGCSHPLLSKTHH